VIARAAAGLIVLSVAVYFAVTLFSFLASATWLGELTTHFRAQMALAGAILVAVAVGLRARTKALAAASASLANFLPLLACFDGAVPAGEGIPFRVLTLNLQHDYADYGAVKALIEREQPDLVALTELGSGARPMIEELRPRFPTVLGEVRRGTFEVVLLSRWRADAYAVDTEAGAAYPVTHARLCRERCVNLVAAHAAPPIRAHGALRAGQFQIAARFASAEAAPTILLGDLNCTPWSPAFDRLLAMAGLRDSGRGRGLHPTWFSSLPFVGLPLDHVLVGQGVGVDGRRVGPDVRSDHFPVIADLMLPPE
jgi:endonuclease/exonuclease/phosphatase (EEP) superfamily protein YafD